MSEVGRVRAVASELRDRVRHRNDSLRCQQVVELVTDYLEDALDAPTRLRFEQHLAGCAECTRYLDQARLTRDAMGRVHPSEPDAETKAALLDAFRRAQQQD